MHLRAGGHAVVLSVLAAVVAAGSLAACGVRFHDLGEGVDGSVAGGGNVPGVADAVDREENACANGSRTLRGQTQPGGACSSGTDCAPACCTCATPTWLSASCVNGACADYDTTCARTAVAGSTSCRSGTPDAF